MFYYDHFVVIKIEQFEMPSENKFCPIGHIHKSVKMQQVINC